MPPLLTHLVVGERTLPHLEQIRSEDHGTFLLGCLLADTNSFTEISRRTTHLVGRLEEDGARAYTESCPRFLAQQATLLRQPWSRLDAAGRAFAAGYLCHLAADERWKALGARIQAQLNITTMADLPIPGDVLLTAFSVLSYPLFEDLPAILMALDEAHIPEVFTHVQIDEFERAWWVMKPALPLGSSPELFYTMLERCGTSKERLREVREQHARHWDEALAFSRTFEPETFVTEAIDHALEVLPDLFRMEFT